jgi:hypothetical protein
MRIRHASSSRLGLGMGVDADADAAWRRRSVPSVDEVMTHGRPWLRLICPSGVPHVAWKPRFKLISKHAYITYSSSTFLLNQKV